MALGHWAPVTAYMDPRKVRALRWYSPCCSSDFLVAGQDVVGLPIPGSLPLLRLEVHGFAALWVSLRTSCPLLDQSAVSSTSRPSSQDWESFHVSYFHWVVPVLVAMLCSEGSLCAGHHLGLWSSSCSHTTVEEVEPAASPAWVSAVEDPHNSLVALCYLLATSDCLCSRAFW